MATQLFLARSIPNHAQSDTGRQVALVSERAIKKVIGQVNCYSAKMEHALEKEKVIGRKQEMV